MLASDNELEPKQESAHVRVRGVGPGPEIINESEVFLKDNNSSGLFAALPHAAAFGPVAPIVIATMNPINTTLTQSSHNPVSTPTTHGVVHNIVFIIKYALFKKIPKF